MIRKMSPLTMALAALLAAPCTFAQAVGEQTAPGDTQTNERIDNNGGVDATGRVRTDQTTEQTTDRAADRTSDLDSSRSGIDTTRAKGTSDSDATGKKKDAATKRKKRRVKTTTQTQESSEGARSSGGTDVTPSAGSSPTGTPAGGSNRGGQGTQGTTQPGGTTTPGY